jgi:hypothetical protein
LGNGDGVMKKVEVKAKREYRPPKLEAYGNLAEVTRATTANTNKNDHSGGKFKTT